MSRNSDKRGENNAHKKWWDYAFAFAASAVPLGLVQGQAPEPVKLLEIEKQIQVESPPEPPLSANTGGDPEFQKGLLKFPDGPLAPARARREAEGGPIGFAGRTPQLPNNLTNADFFPVDDRWRIGFPVWDRYVRGLAVDSYHQNIFKGDYPICGSHDIFFNVTSLSDTFFESRELTKANGGVQNQRQFIQTLATTFDLFKGDNSFHPSEWTVQATPFFQLRDRNFDSTHEYMALQDAFVDYQLLILSDYYDQINLRVGRQAFNADFRGFIFNDTNDGVRLFGNALENRYQYNLFAFNMVQKDNVTQINTFDTRQQQIVGANIIRQDPGDLLGLNRFLGLNVLAAVLYNHDDFRNQVNNGYLELAADGRIGRVNVNAEFIQEFGYDALNPVSKRSENISAQMAALELVYPIDWFFPKVSVLYNSGDRDPKNGKATGFDSIFDNPNFAGGGFSYFQREVVNVGKAQLKNNFTFNPSFRNKFFQASNSVNPGLLLLNTGWDAKLTSRMTLQMNFNYSRMMDPSSAEMASGIAEVRKVLGYETNLGIVYKPLTIDNVAITLGASALVPGDGLKDLSKSSNTLYTLFTAVTLFY